MKTILLKWRQQSEHCMPVNVTDDFDLESLPYGILRSLVIGISSDMDTYLDGYEYAFEVSENSFDPKAPELLSRDDSDATSRTDNAPLS